RNLAGLADAMGNLTRQNSELRRRLMVGAGMDPSQQEAMERSLAGMSRADFAEFANQVKENADNIAANMEAHQRRLGASADAAAARGAQARRSYLEAFGAPDLVQLMEKFSRLSDEEKRMWQQRIDAAREFNKVTTKIDQNWTRVSNVIKTELMGNLQGVVRLLDYISGKLADIAERSEKNKTLREEYWQKKIEEHSQRQEEGTTEGSWLGRMLGLGRRGKPKEGGTPPTRLLDQSGAYGRWPDWPSSSNIEDRRGDIDDPVKAMHQLTDQVKRLADDIERMGGIPGVSVGGGGGGGSLGLLGTGFGGGGRGSVTMGGLSGLARLRRGGGGAARRR